MKDQSKTVRTRIAPSPTGENLHIGNLYTALLNYAFAKKHKGSFIIRIEDTDRLRFIEGSQERILESLRNFGLTYDEGPGLEGPFKPYIQSLRLNIYQEYISQLLEKKSAYHCFCSRERLEEMRKKQLQEKKQPKYDRHCLENVKNPGQKIAAGEKYVIRLRVPDAQNITFSDAIRGDITFNTAEIDDQVLMKSDGFPTYHLSVVIDDYLMKISHIIRAEEWISSTPKHILLYNAFGWELPVFAHLPILRNPDRSKLSKRKNPVWTSWYLDEGFLPEAILNYLALLGWSHPEEKEIFTLEEFINLFDLKDMNPVGPIFDLVKLRWMNQQYIQKLPDDELKKKITKFHPQTKDMDPRILNSLIPLVRTRMETLKEFSDLTAHFLNTPKSNPRSNTEGKIAKALFSSLKTLDTWKKDMIFAALKEVMTTYKIKMPVLYYLLTGKEKGLPLPESLEILGQEETIKRLSSLIKE